ncbi:MAG: transcription elongation factor GreA [Clostridiaceae bacterium]
MNNYLTEDALKKLRDEIEHRKVVVRKKINEDLKEARAHGDLSENFEYKSAKKDRAQNEGRIRYLEKMVRTAKLVEQNTELDIVGIGKVVAITFIDECESAEFSIVTTIESDPPEFKISLECPLGRALFNHKKGDVVLVESPKGPYEVRINNVFNID